MPRTTAHTPNATHAPTPATRRTRAARLAFAAPALAALLLLGGCVYVDGGYLEGDEPDVSIAVSTDTAAPGEVVRLVAAVTAPNGLDYVTFYRFEGNFTTELATLRRGPLQLDTTIPLNAGRTVGYYARACDDYGWCSDSRSVTVDVVR